MALISPIFVPVAKFSVKLRFDKVMALGGRFVEFELYGSDFPSSSSALLKPSLSMSLSRWSGVPSPSTSSAVSVTSIVKSLSKDAP